MGVSRRKGVSDLNSNIQEFQQRKLPLSQVLTKGYAFDVLINNEGFLAVINVIKSASNSRMADRRSEPWGGFRGELLPG